MTFHDGLDQAPPLPSGRPLRLLLAEDTADNQVIFQAYLAGTPHTCELVENGRQAVERFKEAPFDLVLMDMQMPVLDGYAATEEIRRWEREQGRPPTPILALTALVLAHEVQLCHEVGCTAHVAKPIGRRDFIRALAQHAGTGPTAADPPTGEPAG